MLNRFAEFIENMNPALRFALCYAIGGFLFQSYLVCKDIIRDMQPKAEYKSSLSTGGGLSFLGRVERDK